MRLETVRRDRSQDLWPHGRILISTASESERQWCTYFVNEDVICVVRLSGKFGLLRKPAFLRLHTHDLIFAADGALGLQCSGANDELTRA